MNVPYEFDSSILHDGLRYEYAFCTTSGKEYYLHLDFAPEYLEEFSDFAFLGQYGYVLGFYPINEDVPGSPREDVAIGVTICEILKNFLSGMDKVIILFHCDAHDGKQKARKDLFTKWERKYAIGVLLHHDHLRLDIEKENGAIHHEYLGYYAICNDDELEVIKTEFIEFANQKVASMK